LPGTPWRKSGATKLPTAVPLPESIAITEPFPFSDDVACATFDRADCPALFVAVPVQERTEAQQGQAQKRQLITREDVLAALRQGIRVIALQPDAVVTPLARQVAKEKGIELR